MVFFTEILNTDCFFSNNLFYLHYKMVTILEGMRSIPTSKTLFLKDQLADVYFLFTSDEGQNQKIPAHKVILANASEEFLEMFFGEQKEEKMEFEIMDVSAAAFTEVLRCVYANQMILSTEIIGDVMKVAHKYDVISCFEFCERFLTQHLPDDEYFLGFKLSVEHNRTELQEKFERIIRNHAKTLLESNEFLKCSREILISILKIRFLLCDPMDIFEACIEWAKNACDTSGMDSSSVENQRDQLGESIYLIPFRQMDATQIFACIKHQKGLFQPDEVEELFAIAVSFGPTDLQKFRSQSELSVLWNEDRFIWFCHYPEWNESDKHWVNEIEITSIFKSDKNRLLGAVKLAEIRHTEGFKDIAHGILSIVLKNKNGNTLSEVSLLKNKIIIECSLSGSISLQLVKLSEPVLLNANKDYDISISFDSSWSNNSLFAVIPQGNFRNGIIKCFGWTYSD